MVRGPLPLRPRAVLVACAEVYEICLLYGWHGWLGWRNAKACTRCARCDAAGMGGMDGLYVCVYVTWLGGVSCMALYHARCCLWRRFAVRAVRAVCVSLFDALCESRAVNVMLCYVMMHADLWFPPTAIFGSVMPTVTRLLCGRVDVWALVVRARTGGKRGGGGRT
jgi:hypothetical protein